MAVRAGISHGPTLKPSVEEQRKMKRAGEGKSKNKKIKYWIQLPSCLTPQKISTKFH